MADPLDAIALKNNAMLCAFVILAKCLTNNGALRPGQFSDALKSTFNHPDAKWDRLDYEMLHRLAALLDQEMGAPRPTQQ
jgi:hypothetical protein